MPTMKANIVLQKLEGWGVEAFLSTMAVVLELSRLFCEFKWKGLAEEYWTANKNELQSIKSNNNKKTF